MNLLAQGLTLSFTGLAVTFAALGLLILIIAILNRLFARPAPTTSGPQPANGTAVGEVEPAAAAAIALALLHPGSPQRHAADLGDALTRGPGPWWRPLHTSAWPSTPARRHEADS